MDIGLFPNSQHTIDKLVAIILGLTTTHDLGSLWLDTVIVSKKSLRIKVRSIAGDEVEVAVALFNKEAINHRLLFFELLIEIDMYCSF